jgi:hypothetical protein
MATLKVADMGQERRFASALVATVTDLPDVALAESRSQCGYGQHATTQTA